MDISPEQYGNTYNSLPKAVRSFLIDQEFNTIIAGIGNTYGLHVDTMGKLGENASYMLMGLASPAQTLGELILAGIDAETAKKILEDLNQKMFIPVRDRVRNYREPVDEDDGELGDGWNDTQTPTGAPVAPQAIYVPAPAPIETPAPAPMTISSALPHQEQALAQQTPIYSAPQPTQLPPAPAYVPPTPPPPVYVPQAPTPLPVAPTPNPTTSSEYPAMRTMATDMASVQPTHAPSWPAFTHRAQTIPEAAPLPSPAPAMSAPHPFTPNEPPVGFQRTAPLPPNLPGQPQTPIVKQYGTDPYRESV